MTVQFLFCILYFIGLSGMLRVDLGFVWPRCRGFACPIDGRPVTDVVGDKTLDVVDDFCYLGDTLSPGDNCTSAIINKCKVVWGKFRKLLPILTSRNLPLLVCGRVYISCVRPTMLYDGKTCAPNDSDQITWGMLCQSQGWHIVWEFAGQIAFVWCIWRLRLFGHVKCSDNLSSVMDMADYDPLNIKNWKSAVRYRRPAVLHPVGELGYKAVLMLLCGLVFALVLSACK